jgi:hypothetical protein
MTPRRVFLFFACLYVLSLGRGFYSSDGDVMFQTTAALVERGTLALAPDPGLPQIVRGQDDTFYSKYDPGLPLIGVPFYVVGDWIAQVNRAHRYRVAATFYLLVPALAAAGTVASLAVLVRFIGEEPSQTGSRVGWVVLTAGLATPLWPYARVLFAESLLTCVLTLAVVGIVLSESRPRWVWVAGMAFGVGILTRAALAIYALPLVFLIVRLTPARSRVIRLGVFIAGALPFVGLLLWHNTLRFGDPFQFGYAGEGFTTLPWEGVAGLLFSPGKSVFLYAPPLVLSLLLWPRFRRVYPALGDFLALAWGVALVFYGSWWAWHGAWSWGPRFLVPLLPLSCLPLVKLPETRAWRLLAVVLIGAGITVQVVGVLTDVTPHYATLFDPAQDFGSDAARYNRVNFAPRHSPLVGGVERLLRGQTEPLAMFHLAGTGLPPTWTAGVPLVLILGLLAGARPTITDVINNARRPPTSSAPY